ncbi:ThiF family adenylyltransferase [Bifidobacterium aquikefiricola]|uniref:ThiF family adenylyltransferase n=1 Tax=Bifidobacterium aquikefiricola TaxID=3059038 RepID=A0AB39U6K8_9BIFI
MNSRRYEDPDGEIAHGLNTLLKGELSIDDVAAKLNFRGRCNKRQPYSIITQLMKTGHIEDVEVGTFLSKDDQDRYSRSMNYFSWINKRSNPSHWHRQEMLHDSSAAIIGAGGVGSGIAYHMAASGVGKITIVDFDKVELSNLNRQYLFNESDIGKLKSEVVAGKVSQINHDVDVESVNQKIEKYLDIIPLIKESSLFYHCVDSPDAMPFWANTAALKTRVPWVDCSYTGPVIQCCTFVPGMTGRYLCLRESEKRKLSSTGRGEAYSDHVPDDNPGFGPVVQISSALASYEGLRFISHLNPNSVGRAIHQNMYDYSLSYAIEVPKNAPMIPNLSCIYIQSLKKYS